MSKRDKVLSKIDLALAHFWSSADMPSLKLLRQRRKVTKPLTALKHGQHVQQNV